MNYPKLFLVLWIALFTGVVHALQVPFVTPGDTVARVALTGVQLSTEGIADLVRGIGLLGNTISMSDRRAALVSSKILDTSAQIDDYTEILNDLLKTAGPISPVASSRLNVGVSSLVRSVNNLAIALSQVHILLVNAGDTKPVWDALVSLKPALDSHFVALKSLVPVEESNILKAQSQVDASLDSSIKKYTTESTTPPTPRVVRR